MFYTQLRNFKRSVHHDCGLKFIDTTELCTNEIHKLLWTSLDLKARAKNRQTLGNPLKRKRVTMLCSCHSQCVNLIIQAAMKTLDADLRFMVANKWEKSSFKKDIGRFYSLYSDMIMAQGQNHRSLCELSDGATVPVVNISSHKFAPLHGLAVLLTLQEHFGHLSGLSVGWVGPMGNHLNTLLYLLPKVGINLRYNSAPTPNFPASPLVLPLGQAFCKTYKTTIEECDDPAETITGVDVVATSKHRNENLQLDLKMFDKANTNWAFLHLLPRWQRDVTEEVFHHKNSLVWTLHENIQYSAMAVALSLLKEYHPITTKPHFG